jgi:hypothetical protein
MSGERVIQDEMYAGRTSQVQRIAKPKNESKALNCTMRERVKVNEL